MGRKDQGEERRLKGLPRGVVLWPDTLRDAELLQECMRERIEVVPLRRPPLTVAAVDAAFDGDIVIAVASLYDYSSLEYSEDAVCREKTRFPYVPGYLSFREGRAIVNAVKKLTQYPDLLLVDGQGIAHPRGTGIASYLGVILGTASIGCAKSRLVGEFREPGLKRGDWTPLVYQGREVGAVLRTRDNVKPVFVSPGHLVDVRTSLEVVMHCVSQYRIPEPLRRADHVARKLSRAAEI